MQNQEVTMNFLKPSCSPMPLVLQHDAIQLYNSSNIYVLYFRYPRNTIWKHVCCDVISSRSSISRSSVRKGYSQTQASHLNYLKSYVHIVGLRGTWISVKMRIYYLMRREIIPLRGDVFNVTTNTVSWHCRSGWWFKCNHL